MTGLWEPQVLTVVCDSDHSLSHWDHSGPEV